MSFRFRTIDDPSASPGAFSGTQGAGMNNAGEFVGTFFQGGNQVAFSDIAGNFTTLTGPPGASSPRAYGVNNLGQVVGYFGNGSGSSGFLYSGGSYTILNDPSAKAQGATAAFGINDSGVIVGEFVDNGNTARGFKYANGVYTTIQPPGALASEARAVNDAGVIVGDYRDSNFVFHGFIYANGNFTILDDPSTTKDTSALAINASGQIAGVYSDSSGFEHGFLYSNGVYTNFDDPNALHVTIPQGITDAGRISGYYIDAMDMNHGFVATSMPVPHDLDGDLASDILWRNANGTLAGWLMDGASISSGANLTYQGNPIAPDASWSVAGTADFNNDGSADLLWRQNTGALALWSMNGSAIGSSADVTYQGNAVAPDASWSVAGTADFSGDRNADVLWRQSSGALALWSMNGASVTSSSALTYQGNQLAPDASWSVAGVGDFNGDGKADLVWRQNSGALSLWTMDGSAVSSSSAITSQGNVVAPDASWSVAGVGDFNGDGHADLLWRQNTGSVAIWSMNGSSINSSAPITYQGNAVAPDSSWSVVEIGDFLGTGGSDILWRQSTTGALSEWIMNGSQIVSTSTLSTSPDASWQVQGKATNFA